MRTIYGVHGNDNITFLSLDAAETWLMENYPEHCGCKDAIVDFCENMIWEEDLQECVYCNEWDSREYNPEFMKFHNTPIGWDQYHHEFCSE